jgi:hypothetical protein
MRSMFRLNIRHASRLWSNSSQILDRCAACRRILLNARRRFNIQTLHIFYINRILPLRCVIFTMCAAWAANIHDVRGLGGVFRIFFISRACFFGGILALALSMSAVTHIQYAMNILSVALCSPNTTPTSLLRAACVEYVISQRYFAARRDNAW